MLGLVPRRSETNGNDENNNHWRSQLNDIIIDDRKLIELAEAVNQRLERLSDKDRIAIKLRYDLENPSSETPNSYEAVGKNLYNTVTGELGVAKQNARQTVAIACRKLRHSIMDESMYGFSIPNPLRTK